MNLIQITPGAGSMYCGGCFRDNALVSALRRQGHETLMVPLYLPLTLDEPDQSAQTPIFFSGINVYLDQKSFLFRHAPGWLHRLLSSRALLRLAAGRAARTRPEEAGELMVSMLQGEHGAQARELEELLAWLRTQPPPDALCLSNALLVGMARRLKQELQIPVVCLLAGEDTFLDAMPDPLRTTAWTILTERSRDVDLFLPPSRYYGDLMRQRLSLRADQVEVLPNGINVAGYPGPRPARPDAVPTLGYFARMCPQKGLGLLVEAFLLLKKREGTRRLRLHIGGGCGPGDRPFVAQQEARLAQAGVAGDVRWFPNVDHPGKLAFLEGLDVFSTPAHYGEAFGLYVIEALAAGVPVVQPRVAGFPEILEATGGGLLTEPHSAPALADAIQALLANPERARALGAAGRQAVHHGYTQERMAEQFTQRVTNLRARRAPAVRGGPASSPAR